ncbi:MAG: hypothetical protein II401_06280 [Bacteroidales bacterium]|nr:hypothetical protein [Bacteroidales bacterium]
MGYNLAKRKMKKKLIKFFIVVLMLVGVITPLAIKATNAKNQTNSFINSKGYYISATFEATEDNWKCRIYLKYDGTFLMSEREGRDRNTTTGTYSLSNEITKGGQASVSFYVDGEYQGGATLAWPMEQDMMLFMNGFTFNKVY